MARYEDEFFEDDDYYDRRSSRRRGRGSRGRSSRGRRTGSTVGSSAVTGYDDEEDVDDRRRKSKPSRGREEKETSVKEVEVYIESAFAELNRRPTAEALEPDISAVGEVVTFDEAVELTKLTDTTTTHRAMCVETSVVRAIGMDVKEFNLEGLSKEFLNMGKGLINKQLINSIPAELDELLKDIFDNTIGQFFDLVGSFKDNYTDIVYTINNKDNTPEILETVSRFKRDLKDVMNSMNIKHVGNYVLLTYKTKYNIIVNVDFALSEELHFVTSIIDIPEGSVLHALLGTIDKKHNALLKTDEAIYEIKANKIKRV